MYSPAAAFATMQPNGLEPGICGPRDSAEDPREGYFVKYRRQPPRSFLQLLPAAVEVLVVALSGARRLALNIPFLVDSRTGMTVIPRGLVPVSTFMPAEATQARHFRVPAFDPPTFGRKFLASISIRRHGSSVPPISIDNLPVIVAETYQQDYGILGLDALSRMRVVFDSEHVAFWPL